MDINIVFYIILLQLSLQLSVNNQITCLFSSFLRSGPLVARGGGGGGGVRTPEPPWLRALRQLCLYKPHTNRQLPPTTQRHT